MTNQEQLLVKYIWHVVDCEGCDFIDRINDYAGSDVVFTDAERAELERLGEEARRMRTAGSLAWRS